MHLSGPDIMREQLKVCGKTFNFKISPDSFFQPNPEQAEFLYTKVIKLLEPTKDDVVFDLYCGTATMGIIISSFVKKVICVEINPYAVCDAELNIIENKRENIRVYRQDVSKAVLEIQEPVDIVILDPPRAGLGEKAISNVIALSPKKIAYVSCNPRTQSLDITSLCAQGYHLKAIYPVDQFPHTIHLENIAILEK